MTPEEFEGQLVDAGADVLSMGRTRLENGELVVIVDWRHPTPLDEELAE